MRSRKLIVLLLIGFAQPFPGCGPAKDRAGAIEGGPEVQPVGPTGPTVQVSYSVLADVLHLVEGVSLWQQGMPRTYHRAFDDYFGIEEPERKVLKRFAFARSELEERFQKKKSQPTFEAPFGPEGLFPSGTASLVEQFWERVMAAGQPAAVSRALAGVMEPSDAEAVAAALAGLAPRAGELIAQHGKYAQETEALRKMLSNPQVLQVLQAMARFTGVDAGSVTFRVHPVWAPEKAPFEAVAYGDRVLVNIPEGKPIGPGHAALVVHEMGRRLLARMPSDRKAMYTLRFVEKAGRGEGPFLLVEGLLDALSHGVAAPLMAAGPEQVPPWPGDDRRKKLAEALTPLLREYLGKNAALDMAFVNRAADLQVERNPPKPGDFVAGAMVIGEDMTIQPFRSQVVRWTVWKFPPSMKYNFPRKLADNPGRSVLLLFSPKDLRSLVPRFAGMEKLLKAMRVAAGYTHRQQPVVIAVPRESRGYLFVLAAHSAEGMKKLAKAFFALEKIPTVPVTAE